jgi:hypothetical protein
LAFFKLPAVLIGAYFEAVGKVFDCFKANDSKEATAAPWFFVFFGQNKIYLTKMGTFLK